MEVQEGHGTVVERRKALLDLSKVRGNHSTPPEIGQVVVDW